MPKKKTEEQIEVQVEQAAPDAVPSDASTTNITWLGEDDLHEDGHGPAFTTWRGIKFPKGEPVPVSNKHIIEKAKGNRFYSVAD